jgi:hypothetical protein
MGVHFAEIKEKPIPRIYDSYIKIAVKAPSYEATMQYVHLRAYKINDG